MESKKCPKCNTVKLLLEFSKRATRPDGLQIHCKSCVKAYNSSHYYSKRKFQLVENKERQAKWVGNNRERRKAYQKEYYAKTSTKRKAASRAWAKKNVHLIRAYCRKRNAKLKKAAGWDYTTPKHIEQRWLLFGGKCWVCGCDAEAIDHVKPLDKGGAHFPSNLRPICKSCNSKKGSKWPL